MAYLEIVRVDEPQRLWCATFFLGKAGNVVPGGYKSTLHDALHSLEHVLEGRDVKAWAKNVAPMTPGVEVYMEQNSSLAWARLEIPETASGDVEPAIDGMTAGCSVRRGEEYTASTR